MEQSAYTEQPILEARPAWRNYWLNFLFFWLFFLPVLAAIVNRYSLKIRVYPDRVVLEKGILSKDIVELFISDIRAINVKQSIIQRVLRIGDLYIASAGTSGYEERAYGIEHPHRVKELIMNQRRAASDKRQ